MKSLALTKNQVISLVTVVVVVVLGAWYFFVYVPNNEKELRQQRFRTLQNIDRNIQTKLENSRRFLANLLEKYNKEPAERGKIKEYIEAHPEEKFTLSALDAISGTTPKDTGIVDSLKINIVALQKDSAKNDTHFRLHMQFDPGQFFKPLFPRDVFEQYMVISNGKVIYESFASGLRLINTDSLLNARSGLGASVIKDATLGGRDYKMFVQPVRADDHNQYIVIGLLSKDRFDYLRNQLPEGGGQLLIIFLCGIVAVFPWIRLYNMGQKDRLVVADVIFSIVVSMFMVSLLFFLFLKYNVWCDDPDERHKQQLARNIISSFEKEVEQNIRLLKKIDTEPGEKRDRTNLYAWRASLKDTVDATKIYWINKKGVEKVSWFADTLHVPATDYSDREYFKAIQVNKDSAYLDQVMAWSTGDFKSVLSVPVTTRDSNQTTVLAMVFRMRSIHDYILPAGYQFAIVDREGKVLYHSDPTKNLNENLLQELSEKEKFRSSLTASVPHSFESFYYDKEYNLYVKPFSKHPYHLVILESKEAEETRNANVSSFTTVMFFYFSLFTFLQLIGVFLIASKPSYFKKSLFDLGWIGPKQQFHREYAISAVMNFAILVVLLLLSNFTSFFEYLFLLMVYGTLSILVLNLLLQYKHRNSSEDTGLAAIDRTRKRCVSYFLLFILVVTNITAFYILEKWCKLILFQVIILIVIGIIFGYRNQIIEYIKKIPLPRLNKYLHSFGLMVMSRLLITSGVPIILFYIASYNYEQNLYARYSHVQLADQLVQKKIDVNDTLRTGFYPDHLYINEISIPRGKLLLISHTEEDTLTSNLLRRLSLRKTDLAVKTSLFHLQKVRDSISFNHLVHSTENGTVTFYPLPGHRFLKIDSAPLNYKTRFQFFSGFGFVYVALFILALVSLYLVILNVIKKLFAIHIYELSDWKKLDEAIYTDPELNKRLFIIGSPGAGRLRALRRKMDRGEIATDTGEKFVYQDGPDQNVLIIDLTLIPDSTADKDEQKKWDDLVKRVNEPHWRLIIIHHFEYNIKDDKTNHIKLNLLENLHQIITVRLIIVSTIHPVSFLDSFNINEATVKQDLERWHVQFGKYLIIIQEVDENLMSYRDEVSEENADSKESADPEKREWVSIVNSETSRTNFLISMQKAVKKVAMIKTNLSPYEKHYQSDTLALKLQVTSHYFYMYIWQSLTREEKFLLFDLAEDGLVNSYDDHNLCILLEKGLIIRKDGTLKLFNKGFRNFILTAIGNSEAMKIKNEMRDEGNWNQVKTPLIIIITAILIFLLLSRQEAYTKLVGYATILGTGIPAVIKILSYLDRSNNKTPQQGG